MQYGVDVGKLRIDDWDKLILKQVAEHAALGQMVSVLEVGCGGGAQAVRLAEVGAFVQAIDVADYGVEILKRAETAGVTERVGWQQVDAFNYVNAMTESTLFSYINMQRVLHYLPYEETVLVLQKLSQATSNALYLSVTGVTTAIAKHHPFPNAPLNERLKMISNEGQSVFSITAPICPYSQVEVEEMLFATGWQIEKIRTSDFGNIKVVARPAGLGDSK